MKDLVKVDMDDIISSKQRKIGKEPRNNSPVTKYCRKLLKDGFSPETELLVYRGDILAIRIPNIGKAAEFAILENEKKGPIFVKYQPMSEKTVEALKKTG